MPFGGNYVMWRLDTKKVMNNASISTGTVTKEINMRC